jgi:predicted nuclease with TOPRIM domain
MVTEIIAAALSGGVLTLIFSRFFMTKKEEKDYVLQLVATLSEQVERQQKQYDTMQKDFVQLQQNYNHLQQEYNQLQAKYNQLKQEFNNLKQAQ